MRLPLLFKTQILEVSLTFDLFKFLPSAASMQLLSRLRVIQYAFDNIASHAALDTAWRIEAVNAWDCIAFMDIAPVTILQMRTLMISDI